MKNISYPEKESINRNFDFRTLTDSNTKCCYTCAFAGILPSDYYFCQKHGIYLTDEVDYVVEHICEHYEKEE